MEIVAGVASVGGVVGILGLVGHTVHGILKLKEFVHGISTASKTVESFVEAIDSLESTLTAISDLLKRAPEEWLVGAEARNTNILTSQVKKCQDDIDEWIMEIPKHHTDSSKAIKSFLKKLHVASHESTYSKFHQKVARHLQGMQMSLGVLGCSYNMNILKQADVIAENVKDFAEAQTSFNHEVIQRFPEPNESFIASLSPVSSQLDRLENSSQISSASMSSLASNVSRILELVSSKPALAITAKSDDGKMESSVGHVSSAYATILKTKLGTLEPSERPSQTRMEWCCDFLPGIEAAFSSRGSVCLYCGDEFDELGQHQDPAEWSLRESKEQNLTDDFHSIRGRRWKALFDNKSSLKAIHEGFGGATPVLPPESAQNTELLQRPSELDLYTAFSEEGCIVDGLMVASIFRPWSLFNIHGDDQKKFCHSLGDGINVSRYEFDDHCDSHLEATRLPRTENTSKEPGLGEAELLRKSSATSVFPKHTLDRAEVTKERSRINSWLQGMLKSSPTTKIIMFHTMKEHGVHLSDMYTWLEKVLEVWDLDEAATKVDEPENPSDGAVDSRGSPEVRDVANVSPPWD
ncbi:MAG: hypothetical protein Q9161_008912 [Pseudevernia consocians]